MSNPAFDKIIPVNPPIVNKQIKPNANRRGVLTLIIPSHKVAIQLKIFIPVGTPMIIVAAIK